MPNFLRLPKLIFLMNGTPTQSNALAQAIATSVPQGCIEHFLEPVTSGVVGIYYGDTPYDGYLAFDKPETKCRNSNWTLGNRRSALRSWLEAHEGQSILGRLASRRVEEGYELFSHFIFPDAEHGFEIEPLMRRFADECLLVLAPGMNVPGPLADGPIDVVYARPEDTIAKLSAQSEEAVA